MKCICPMSSGQECPSTCTPTTRAKYRRKLAHEYLTKGMSHANVATELGISERMVYEYAETFEAGSNVKGKGKDTLGRKKSTGRPRNTRSSKPMPRPQTLYTRGFKLDDEQAIAKMVLDDGKTQQQVRKETGLEVHAVRVMVAKEIGRREAEPLITPDMLSMSAQQKFDVAIRQEKARLAAKFDQEVHARCQERFNELWLPELKQKVEQAQEIYNNRRGIISKYAYRLIRSALHYDSRKSISDERLNEAFYTFEALEKFVLNEKDSPTSWPELPKDWDAMKRATTATRKRKPGHSELKRRA